ncbi:MAG: YihA family ribosome biogenesis GTP-binding protein [Clostridia bacterium]|nr:YihA family ribosome biogenesis GTP-binding protein [Clostridia bacterium]
MLFNPTRADLRITAGLPSQFPRDPLPQIAFSGRSNVGKSSLVNSLLGRNSLARVSSSPGKTITVNFYEIDRKLFFVDLPGYGYANRSKESQRIWQNLTDGYFTRNPNRDLLRLVVQLIDARIGATKDDLMMIDWLNSCGVPFLLVATKTDKLNKTERAEAEQTLRQLAETVGAPAPVFYSSKTKEGKDELLGRIAASLG